MRANVVAHHSVNNGNPSILVLTTELEEHEDKWVATLLELGVSTYAESLQEVREEITDALLLQLNEVERLGFLNEYLEEHGVKQISLPNPSSDPNVKDNWGLATVGA